MICLGIGDLDNEPLIGGHENNVVHLSHALHENGHKIIIITTPSIHSCTSESKIVNFKWGIIYSIALKGPYGSMSFGLEFLLKSLLLIKKLKNEDGIDIIHGHSGFPILGLFTSIIGNFLDIPCIHTLYCPIGNSFNKKIVGKLCFSYVDLIISLSNNTYTSLTQCGIGPERIKIIPPFINDLFINYSKRGNFEKINKKSINFNLLYLGDLTKGRGLHILIEALNNVRYRNPNVILWLAINMPAQKYKICGNFIEKMVEKYSLEKNIIFLGMVKNMPEVMYTSAIFVAPYIEIDSIADLPVSILESMAVGTPVIASNVGGIPEIIHHQNTGLLVKPGDPFDLAEKINYLLDNPMKSKSISCNAHDFIMKAFKGELITTKIESAYQEVRSYNRRH